MPPKIPLKLFVPKAPQNPIVAPSPLAYWVKGEGPFVPYAKLTDDDIDLEKGLYVRIEDVLPVHQSVTLKPQPFAKSIELCDKFVTKSLRYLKLNEPQTLTAAQSKSLLNKFKVPVPCYPLYFITIKERVQVVPLNTTVVGSVGQIGMINEVAQQPSAHAPLKETLAYLGKTSEARRFHAGHHAITKLHAPKYEGFDKFLYRGRVILKTNNGFDMPLEWIRPKSHAKELLADLEKQLIFAFQPELNSDHKANLDAKVPRNASITNLIAGCTFLRHYLCIIADDIPKDLSGLVEVAGT